MKKYRHIANIGLLLIQIALTVYFFYLLLLPHNYSEIRNYISIASTVLLLILVFKNKNLFTLVLGLNLLTGNFAGLSIFTEIWTYKASFNIGSFPIPLYWGQPFYSILLFIYIIFNKEFYIGILGKDYWVDFLTRTEDLERVVTVINLAPNHSKVESEQSEESPTKGNQV